MYKSYVLNPLEPVYKLKDSVVKSSRPAIISQEIHKLIRSKI